MAGTHAREGLTKEAGIGLGIPGVLTRAEARELAEELAGAPLWRLEANSERLGALEESIAVLEAVRNRVGYEQLAQIGSYLLTGGWQLHGMHSAAEWVAWRLNVDQRTARERVRVARALQGLPAIDAAFARGDVGYSGVRALTRVATSDDEERWLDVAATKSCDELDRACRAGSDGSGDTAPVGEGGTEPERWVSVNATEDGMARIVAQVRPEEAALFEKALQVALREAFAGSAGGSAEPVGSAGGSAGGSAEPVDSAGGSKGGSAEPDRFGRADALVAIANTFLGLANEPARTPGRFEVQVRVDADVLRGERSGYGPDALCELDDGTPLEPEAARRIACDAALVLYTTDEDGTPLDMGRRRRTITPALARALWKRDGGCVWPGCGCVLFLKGHHLVHWVDGGETNLENLVLVCDRHHPAVHEGGRRIERSSDGSLSFYDSLGREVKKRPLLPEVPGRLFGGVGATTPRRPRKSAPTSVPRQVWSDSLAALRGLELRAREAQRALERAVAASPDEAWEDAAALVGAALRLLPSTAA